MDALQPGDPQWVGRYRLLSRLGTGGMGRVFLGQSPSGRLVAVKLIRPELADDPGFRRRFAQEVSAARRVSGIFTAPVVVADPAGLAPSPELSVVAIAPPGMEPGTWSGSASSVFDGSDIVLAYRVRKPIGQGRGYAVVIARSADGVQF